MYESLKAAHVVFATVTIAGFVLRGYWMLAASPMLTRRLVRIAPHVIDTLFLVTGIAMLFTVSLNPLGQPWLLAKFAGLVAYIVLGSIALKRGRTQGQRTLAFFAAVLVFAWIVGVALTKSVAPWTIVVAS